MPLKNILLSNVIEIGICYFDKDRQEDVSEWHLTVWVIMYDIIVGMFIIETSYTRAMAGLRRRPSVPWGSGGPGHVIILIDSEYDQSTKYSSQGKKY